MTTETLRRTLHELVEALDEKQALEALSFVEWLTEPARANDETLALVDEGEAQIDAGEFFTLADLERDRKA